MMEQSRFQKLTTMEQDMTEMGFASKSFGYR